MEQYLVVGQVLKPRGIKGEIKVLPLTEDITRFDFLDYVLIENENKQLKKYNIEYVKYSGNMVYVKLKYVDDIEHADKLRRKYLKIHRKDAIQLKEGEYFICDIIGLKVYDQQDEYIGEISDVIKTGSNDVYVVKREYGKTILLPAIKDVVKKIDLDKGIIKVQLMEGLI